MAVSEPGGSAQTYSQSPAVSCEEPPTGQSGFDGLWSGGTELVDGGKFPQTTFITP